MGATAAVYTAAILGEFAINLVRCGPAGTSARPLAAVPAALLASPHPTLALPGLQST